MASVEKRILEAGIHGGSSHARQHPIFLWDVDDYGDSGKTELGRKSECCYNMERGFLYINLGKVYSCEISPVTVLPTLIVKYLPHPGILEADVISDHDPPDPRETRPSIGSMGSLFWCYVSGKAGLENGAGIYQAVKTSCLFPAPGRVRGVFWTLIIQLWKNHITILTSVFPSKKRDNIKGDYSP